MDEAEVAAVTTEMLESIQQNSGCSFVARLVENYNPDSWFTAVLAGNLSVATSESLEAVQDEEVALLIFPEISSPIGIADFLQALPESRWKVANADEALLAPDISAVSLRWTLPGGKYVTYAMGFGDFDEMPPTRKSRYTAIALRLKGPRPGRKKGRTVDGKKLVTFGDVPTLLDPGDKTQHQKNLDSTREQKIARLAGHSSVLLGKTLSEVAFILPGEFRKRLFRK